MIRSCISNKYATRTWYRHSCLYNRSDSAGPSLTGLDNTS